MTKSVAQLAADIVSDGLAKFVGNGITIEIARRVTVFPLDIGGNQQRGTFTDYVALCRIEPTAKAQQDRPKTCDDTANAAIRSSGYPGSDSRLNALAAFYSRAEQNGQSSPFSITDDGIARRLAQAQVEREQRGVVSVSPSSALPPIAAWRIAGTIQDD